MADVLGKLDRDHEDFRVLLAVLEGQLEFLRNGADADLDLIEDVLECCESYTDCAHHPTESMVSDALAHVGPPLPEVRRELCEVQTRIHHLTHGLLALVQDTLQDAIRPRTPEIREAGLAVAVRPQADLLGGLDGSSRRLSAGGLRDS